MNWATRRCTSRSPACAPRSSDVGLRGGLKARGAQAEIDFERKLRNHPMGDHHRFAGFPAIKALEQKYLPADELRKKYDDAIGL